MALAQAGKVTLHTKTYPLDAAPDAFADLDAGRVRGRAILVNESYPRVSGRCGEQDSNHSGSRMTRIDEEGTEHSWPRTALRR